MKKTYLILSLFLFPFCGNYLSGQNTSPINPILTADSLSSGNYKDVLTSFFRLGLRDLTGPNRQVDFSSNLFAIMLKQNPNLDIDTNYVKYKLARNTNIDLGIKMNDGNRFNGGSLGIKYAIINRRDYTVSKEFISLALAKNHDLFILNDELSRVRAGIADPALRTLFRDQTDKFFNDSSFTYDKLDPRIKKIVIQTARDSNLIYFINLVNNNPNVCINKNAIEEYNKVKNSFQNKALWTASINLKSYDDQFQLSNLNLTTEFLKGVVNPKALSNLEVNLKANLEIVDDSAHIGRDLNRTIFSAEGGLNWVMKGWAEDQSFIEFKLTASENYILAGLYKEETNQLFTLNGTLRIRVSNNISIPIEIKYDPKTGNVFGFLNITSNFTGQGKSKHK
jgi:hypothetical protein